MRGANYLRDRKKVPSQEPAFQLAAVELCSTPGTVQHISQYLPAVMHSRAAFLMPMHFSLPYAGKNYHLVCVFALQVRRHLRAGSDFWVAGFGGEKRLCSLCSLQRVLSTHALFAVFCPIQAPLGHLDNPLRAPEAPAPGGDRRGNARAWLQGLPEALDSDEPFTAALAQYYAGTSAADDERRDRTLKMIPTVRISLPL